MLILSPVLQCLVLLLLDQSWPLFVAIYAHGEVIAGKEHVELCPQHLVSSRMWECGGGIGGFFFFFCIGGFLMGSGHRMQAEGICATSMPGP